jgi:hypothetical protein
MDCIVYVTNVVLLKGFFMTTLTTEEIIEMAKESNLLDVIDSFHYETNIWVEEATAFAKLVRNDYSNKHAQLWLKRIDEAVKAEREACADMVFRYISQTDNMEARGCLASVAHDIRARGEA